MGRYTVTDMVTEFTKNRESINIFPENAYILTAASAASYPFLLWLRVAEPL